MTNLGNVDLGDGIRFETVLTNISLVIADATDIRISVIDNSNVKRINESTMTKNSTGTYTQDTYLDPSVFTEGLHRAIFSGYTTNVSSNVSFYDSNTFYIEDNRLI